MAKPLTESEDSLYECDSYAWTQEQAARLRARAHGDIDWENAAEETRHRIGVILLHLLKWEFQQQECKPGWLPTLDEQRDQVATLLAESLSLRSSPAEAIGKESALARRRAAAETGMPLIGFPSTCPYSADEVLVRLLAGTQMVSRARVQGLKP